MTQPLRKDSPQLDHHSLMVIITHIRKLGWEFFLQALDYEIWEIIYDGSFMSMTKMK